MLTLDNLSIVKNERKLINGLGITIFYGGALCIYGANGIGKTSLLRAIAGLSSFDGKISYNDNDIQDLGGEYRTIVSYQGHQNFLDQELTVFENLLFWARLSNMEHALGAGFSVFELIPYEDFKVSELSQGWSKKVSLTRLLLSQSLIWILDEPFANLDDMGIKRLKEIIKVRCMNGGMVIFSSQHVIYDDNIINLSLADYRHA